MPQETRVLQLKSEAAARLAEQLDAAQWTRRGIPHSRFSLSGPGVTVTYYNSGKLVVQGVDLDDFAERYLQDATSSAGSSQDIDDERIGTDEAGKGDYFGALTVAAVYVNPADIPRFRKIGVADSKTLSDETVARIAGALEASSTHSIVVLDPEQYNQRYKLLGNVNKLLGELHAEAILAVAKRTDFRRVLTDQFGDMEHVRRGLGMSRSDFDLEARPRAESHVAVAAASILARNAFLTSLKRLSDNCGLDLPKGAGDPVDKILRKVVSVVGRDGLPKLAKVHFRTTEKVLGQLF